jgi:hypothetical protein
MAELLLKLVMFAGGIGFVLRCVVASRRGYFTMRSVVRPVISRDDDPNAFSVYLVANYAFGIGILLLLAYLQFFYKHKL